MYSLTFLIVVIVIIASLMLYINLDKLLKENLIKTERYKTGRQLLKIAIILELIGGALMII